MHTTAIPAADPTVTADVTPPAIAATAPTHRRPTRGPLAGAVESEWIKLRSVRSTPLFLGLTAAVGIGMSLILGRVVETDPYDDLPFTIGNTFLVASWLSTLFAVVAGTLLFTSEVQHGTLAGAFTARPRRTVVVTAKAIVAAGLGLAMGALGIVGGLVGGIASGVDAGDMSGAASGIGWALALTTMAAVLGLGVGLVVRHSAAAVTSVLVWALAVETLVRGMVPASVSRLLPFTAAHGLLGTRSAAETPETLAATLPNIANAAVIGGWAVAAVGIGSVLVVRREA
jgi:ABC-2 type transport system permease protein